MDWLQDSERHDLDLLEMESIQIWFGENLLDRAEPEIAETNAPEFQFQTSMEEMVV